MSLITLRPCSAKPSSEGGGRAQVLYKKRRWMGPRTGETGNRRRVELNFTLDTSYLKTGVPALAVIDTPGGRNLGRKKKKESKKEKGGGPGATLPNK